MMNKETIRPKSNEGSKKEPASKVELHATPTVIPGITHPFQLLKYSAISRCGMVQKQIEDYSNSVYSTRRVMVAKINQDSFQVQKGFP